MAESKRTESGKIENAMAQIEKIYGKGSLYVYGEGIKTKVSSISTGSYKLDLITGIGGLPRGRVVEIYGPESSGKTTICLHAIAEAQSAGLKAAFIDAEHALDPVYATNIGVNMDELLLSQPDYGEMALDVVDKLVETGEVGIIVVDSVAALVPRAELDGEMGDAHMALQARLMSQALRKLTGKVLKSNTLLIFINQLRSKIGVMFGNPETTTGGNALKFYASMRLDIRRQEAIKIGNDVVGNKTKVKVVKSKVSPPFKECIFDIRYGIGVDRVGEVIDLGVEYGLIKKGGAWFTYGDDRFQGMEKLRECLENFDNGLYLKLAGELFGE